MFASLATAAESVFSSLSRNDAQSFQFFRRRKLVGADLFVVGARENFVAKGFRVIEDRHVRTPRRGRLLVVDAVLVHLALLGRTGVDHLLGFREIAVGKLLLAFLVLAVRAFVVRFFGFVGAALDRALIALVLVLVGLRLVALIDHFENLEQVANLAAELLLVFR